MYGGHFIGHISLFLTRRHNPRGQFEDTKDEEIDLWEDVDEKEDVVGLEEFYELYKEEKIDIKDNLIITFNSVITQILSLNLEHNARFQTTMTEYSYV